MGLPPDFTSFTRSVFRPMAAMAMMMKNLESVFSGANTAASAPAATAMVVMMLATRKNRMNIGKARFSEKLPRPSAPSLRAMTMPSTSVMGMMASVRVSFTMVASSRAFEPGCMPSQAAAAAVTDEVSFTAVPANRPKPSLDMPSMPPRVGKMSAATTLNRKMTEMAWATCSSLARMTGAVAAMADPPQMDEPTAMSVAMAESTDSTR